MPAVAIFADMLRKIPLLMLALWAFTLTALSSDEVALSQLNLPNNARLSSAVEVGNCIVSFGDEGEAATYKRWGAVEIPESGVVRVEAKSGLIRKVIFKFFSTGSFSADTGTYDTSSNTWTGESPMVTFTNTTKAPSMMYITSMLVVYDSDLTIREPYVVRAEYIGDDYFGREHIANQLTFYYDSSKAEWQYVKGADAVFELPLQNAYPQWNINTVDLLPVDLVAFDASFADFRPQSTASWFENTNVRRVKGMENLNTSETVDMEMMFSGCTSLESLDLSHFDTSSATNLTNLFNGCSSLVSLDISSFTINGTTNGMLHGCKALKNLIVSGSMSELHDDACSGIGTQENPCVIIAPEDFDFGTGTEAGFMWKGGYFSLEPTAMIGATRVDLQRGGQCGLDILLTNGNATFNGFQMDIALPDGITLVSRDNTFIYTLGDRYSGEGFEVIVRQLDENRYRLMGYSLSNVAITGNSGPLLTLTLQADNELDGSTLEGSVAAVSLSTVDKVTVDGGEARFEINVSGYRMGDVDHDGRVNVVDVMMTINHVLGNFDYNYHNENADMDFSGKTNVVDIMTIITLILDSMG